MFGKDKSSFLEKVALFGGGYIFGHMAGQKDAADPDAPPKKTMLQSAQEGTKAINSWTTLAAYLLLYGPILGIQFLVVIFFYIPIILFGVAVLFCIAVCPFVTLFTVGPTGTGIMLCIVWCIGYYIIWKVIQEQRHHSKIDKIQRAANLKAAPKLEPVKIPWWYNPNALWAKSTMEDLERARKPIQEPEPTPPVTEKKQEEEP